MSRQWSGGGLIVVGLGLYGFVALDMLGIVTLGFEALFLIYGLLIVILGGGVYAGEIRFEEKSAMKYEGLILMWAFLIVIMLFGTIVISLS